MWTKWKEKRSSGKNSNMILHWNKTKVNFVFAVLSYHLVKSFVWILTGPAGQHALLFPMNLMIKGVRQEPDGNESIHEPLLQDWQQKSTALQI